VLNTIAGFKSQFKSSVKNLLNLFLFSVDNLLFFTSKKIEAWINSGNDVLDYPYFA